MNAQYNESVIHSVMSDSFVTPWTIAHPWNSPGKNIGVDFHSLLQEMFPTQGSNLWSTTLQADSLLPEPPGKPSAQ